VLPIDTGEGEGLALASGDEGGDAAAVASGPLPMETPAGKGRPVGTGSARVLGNSATISGAAPSSVAMMSESVQPRDGLRRLGPVFLVERKARLAPSMLGGDGGADVL
jgi:hypothetical protein